MTTRLLSLGGHWSVLSSLSRHSLLSDRWSLVRLASSSSFSPATTATTLCSSLSSRDLDQEVADWVHSNTYWPNSATVSAEHDAVLLPFATDIRLRDSHLSPAGQIRYGLVLEHMDALAGQVAYLHANGTSQARPLTIVTAAVDRINVCGRLSATQDLFMKASVRYVGRSSMEVGLDVMSVENDEAHTNESSTGIQDPQSSSSSSSSSLSSSSSSLLSASTSCATPSSPSTASSPRRYRRIMDAYFVMVARDRHDMSVAMQVPPLRMLGTAEQQKALAEGQQRQMRRKADAARSLRLQPPDSEESLLIHQLFVNQLRWTGVQPPPGEMTISETRRQSTQLVMPQQRNLHGKMFGGIMMRTGFELAYATAHRFAGQRPEFLNLDDLVFHRPVDVGAYLCLDAYVCYTEGRKIHVIVHARVEDPTSGSRDLTNTFNFTFFVRRQLDRSVRPHTYEEAMWYLMGRRISSTSRVPDLYKEDSNDPDADDDTRLHV